MNAFDAPITYLANIFKSAVIYAIDKNGNVVEDDELVKLLLNPNPIQGKTEFLSEFYYHLRSAGWNYVCPYHKSVGYNKRIDEVKLFNLNPDNISFNKIRSTIFDLKSGSFKYSFDNGERVIKLPLSTDDVIIFYDTKPSSTNPYVGHSRLKSLKEEGVNTLLADRGKRNQIKRTGAGIISHREKTDSLSDGLDEEMYETKDGKSVSYKEDLEFKLNGAGLAQGKSILVSSKDLRYESLAKEIIGIEFDKLKQADLRVIANKIGVPNELNPFEGDNAKYENREQAQFSVIQNEIEPVGEGLAAAINRWFDKHPNKLIFDYSHLPAYQVAQKTKEENKDKIVDRVIKLLDNELISREDADNMLINYEILKEDV